MLDDLKAMLDHEPFTPFRMVTSGGSYKVTRIR